MLALQNENHKLHDRIVLSVVLQNVNPQLSIADLAKSCQISLLAPIRDNQKRKLNQSKNLFDRHSQKVTVD